MMYVFTLFCALLTDSSPVAAYVPSPLVVSDSAGQCGISARAVAIQHGYYSAPVLLEPSAPSDLPVAWVESQKPTLLCICSKVIL